jgi:hypothetical protein
MNPPTGTTLANKPAPVSPALITVMKTKPTRARQLQLIEFTATADVVVQDIVADRRGFAVQSVMVGTENWYPNGRPLYTEFLLANYRDRGAWKILLDKGEKLTIGVMPIQRKRIALSLSLYSSQQPVPK